jgi:acetolactate synthase regulatory subunit
MNYDLDQVHRCFYICEMEFEDVVLKFSKAQKITFHLSLSSNRSLVDIDFLMNPLENKTKLKLVHCIIKHSCKLGVNVENGHDMRFAQIQSISTLHCMDHFAVGDDARDGWISSRWLCYHGSITL